VDNKISKWGFVMKVLIFNTFYYPIAEGGTEKSVQELAEALTCKGLEVVIVTTSNRDYVDFVNKVKVYYVKVPNLYWSYESKKFSKARRLFWHVIDQYNFFLREKIEKVISDEQPDIVHTNNLLGFSVAIWDVAKARNLPLVHTLHDYYLLCWRSSMFKGNDNCLQQCFDCRVLSHMRKKLSAKVEAVIGVSDFVLRRHLDAGYFPKAAIRICIYNSISEKIVSNKRDYDKQKIRFGFVGALSPAKGVELICRLFTEQLVGQELYIFGTSLEKKYEARLRREFESSCVVFKGFKPQDEIYVNLDVLLVPSLWHEPFGKIIIEANSFGIPVIAANVGGISEIVVDGQTGFLFDPNKPKTILDEVDLLINNPSLIAEMSHKCQEHARTFNSASFVNKYVRVYENSLLEHKTKKGSR
jgi:glycosyltransferase involved in cell wall biosynthesis